MFTYFRTTLFRCCAVFLISVALGGCSMFGSGSGTPEAKATALVFANGYLTAILNGQLERVETLVIWSKYLKNSEVDQTKMAEEVLSSQKEFTQQNHPLYNLTLTDMRMRGDDVNITLERIDGPVRVPVKVHLMWAVNGWGIVDDNIFGEDGVFEEAKKLANAK